MNKNAIKIMLLRLLTWTLMLVGWAVSSISIAQILMGRSIILSLVGCVGAAYVFSKAADRLSSKVDDMKLVQGL